MTDSETASPPLLLSPKGVWWIRGCAFLAAGLCGLLVYWKLSGAITSLQGCGGRDGCHQVLGGRWSAWLGLPVSALALTFYLGVIFLTLPIAQRWMRFNADRLLCAAGFLAVLCAAWFIGILAVAEKTFCPYCATAHLLGMLFAIPVLRAAWKVRGEEGTGFLPAAASAAITAFVILVLGQVFGRPPDTFEITGDTGGAANGKTAQGAPATAPTERLVSFQGGQFTYSMAALPHLGAMDAENIFVEYFDYTCGSCRDMYGDLVELKKRHGSRFAVIVLAAPLSRQCNPNLAAEVPEHQNACEAATLSLAFWRAAPEQFPAYHDFLMKLPVPPDPAKMRAQADQLAGKEKMDAALQDPWVKERLSENMNQYRIFAKDNIRMPKLLLRNEAIMHGPAPSTERFIEVVTQMFPSGQKAGAGR